MKTPQLYAPHAKENLESFMSAHFGDSGCVFHEIQSDYVHSDVYTFQQPTGGTILATGGMGARAMDVPVPHLPDRCELLLHLSDEVEPASPDGYAAANQLVSISKYPFRKSNWLGNGHTMDTTDTFREAFGYDFVAFWDRGPEWTHPTIGSPVHFFTLVPLYEQEREWCVENHTAPLLEGLYQRYGDAIFRADFKRDVFIPEMDEDDLYAHQLMSILNIDRDTLDRLGDYLTELQNNGDEISYDIIGRWVEENR